MDNGTHLNIKTTIRNSNDGYFIKTKLFGAEAQDFKLCMPNSNSVQMSFVFTISKLCILDLKVAL